MKRLVSGLMLTLLITSLLAFMFNVQPVKGEWTGTVYIRADGSIEPPDAPIITHDNITYTLTDNITSIADGIIVEKDNIIIDGSGYTLQGSGASKGTDLAGRINVTVTNIIIKNFSYGIHLSFSSNNKISRNNILGNGDGVFIVSSSNNNIVSDNNVINSVHGVCIEHASNNAIIGNYIANGSGNVFILLNASNNSISGNTIANNGAGIFLAGSSNNSITENNITLNNYYGIWLSNSSDNSIYHNNFIDNVQQVYYKTTVNANIWDDGYPSGGNYWSDYTGTDLYSGPYQNETGSDGIGDMPYGVNENNVDRYPLMGPFGGLTLKGLNVTAYPSSEVCLIFENVTSEGTTSVNVTDVGPEPSRGFKLAGNYYDIKTTANYAGTIKLRIIYDDSNITLEEELSLRLMQWDDVSQQWVDITTSIDTENNMIYGESTHLSLFVIVTPKPARVIPIPNVPGSFFFKNLIITPAESSIGEEQNFTIWARHPLGISKVIAVISWGMETMMEETVELNLVEGSEEEGRWQGSWIVKSDRSCYIIFHFRAWNIEGGEGLPLRFEFEPYREISLEGFPSERAMEWACWSGARPTPKWAIIDPCNPKEGEIQIYAIRYVDSKGVRAVTAAYIPYPSGNKQVIIDLKLVEGSPQDGWWMGAWKVRYYPPDEDYQVRFEAWNTEGEYSEATLTVIPPYALTIIATDGGTTVARVGAITDLPPGTYFFCRGYCVEVRAIPDVNYLFDHWELDGINVGSTNPYTLYIDKDHTLKAFFSAIPPLMVSINPLSASIIVGQSVSFTSTASGEYPPYNYQWYLNGSAVSGATSDTWTFTPTSAGTYNVYLKVIDSAGNVAISDTAIISVVPQLTISISPTSASILVGQSLTFTSTTSGGYMPYTYQWYLDDNSISGATTGTWTFTPTVTGTFRIYLMVTDGKGNTAKSNEAIVTVAPKLIVSISPMNASTLVGQSITFTSTVSGGYPPYTYQWFLNGNPVSGATSNTWAFTPTTSGIFYVYLKVTDAKGNTAQSDAARIVASTVPVGGYSIPIQLPTTVKPVTIHIALLTIITAMLITIKQKTRRKHRQ
jgi:parallel beta-helix repeat protein